jgi:hypothetical protein
MTIATLKAGQLRAPSRRLRLRCAAALGVAALLAWPMARALAFCGFYVAAADAKLFNSASKVVLARDGTRASVTMASDYEGDPSEFALVVPVPTVVQRPDIRVVDPKLVDKLDAYSAPRVSEYFDQDPCEDLTQAFRFGPGTPVEAVAAMPAPPTAPSVTIEARYEVGVYDILILSAKDSGGLVDWLKANHYRIPEGAGPVLGSYIRQGLHFFVAKVNIARQGRSADHYLKPLQVSYESPKFMLPIRLGTVNARGPQDLILFILSRKGRVETSNYQTAKMDSGLDVPVFVGARFGRFYKAAFERRVAADGMSKVYMEYGWDMRSYAPCDPCSAPVPDAADLFALGARWQYPAFADKDADRLNAVAFSPEPVDAYLTRLHVRYDAAHFPEDLGFVETADRSSFQAIFKLRHPAATIGACPAGADYRKSLAPRFAAERKTLARLTGWAEAAIAADMEKSGEVTP